ncbi:MAG: monofunctional biosynthetic peptidoglycan transglycosylase [Flavobacteriaceae bacterium]
MLKKILTFIKKLLLWFFGLSILSVIVFRFVPVPVTPLMISRAVETRTWWNHDWVPIEEISPNLQWAVVASEDQNFLTHNGFDLKAIEKAIEHNKKSKRVRGASTISQQVAKNVFLWQGRSWVRKGLEVYFTFLIELFWSKERIMEVYLNSIEMGNGVYGAEAASKYWYGKSAKKLTQREAAGIAAILPNPRKFKASNSSPYIERRKTHIIRQMNNIGRWEY